MRLEIAKFVEVADANVTLPVKLLVPENVLLLARSVVDAEPTVMEPPTFKVVPLIVPSGPVRRFVPIEVEAMS